MTMPTRPALATLALFVIAGCAGSHAEYPSLSIRDVERTGSFEVPAPVPTPTASVSQPMPAETSARLARLVAEGRAAHARFQSAVPSAERAMRAGGRAAITSEAKANALVALADLDSRRSATAVPLGDLDQIYASAATGQVDSAAAQAARDTVAALVANEDATLARLRGMTN